MMKRTSEWSLEGQAEPRAVAVWPAAKWLLEAWPEWWDEVGVQPEFYYDEDTKTSRYVGIGYVFFKAGTFVQIVIERPQAVLDAPELLHHYLQAVVRLFTKAGVPMPDTPDAQEAA